MSTAEPEVAVFSVQVQLVMITLFSLWLYALSMLKPPPKYAVLLVKLQSLMFMALLL